MVSKFILKKDQKGNLVINYSKRNKKITQSKIIVWGIDI